MKKPKLKTLQNKADKFWRTKDKEGATCEICGKDKRLDPHHVVGRRNKTLRWDLRNRCFLCVSCHVFGLLSAHQSPLFFADWFKKHRPEDYKYLMEKQYLLSKFTIKDMEEIIKKLSK